MYDYYDKYKKNKFLFEFIMNYYLIVIGFRKMFQIQLCASCCYLPYITKLNNFIIKNKIPHKKIIQTENEKCIKFIFFHEKFNINKIKKLNGKEFAQNLGDFYIFASENYYDIVNSKNSCRISINLSNNYNKCELYAQWGNKCQINKNMHFFINYSHKLEKIFHQLDPKIKVFLKINQ